MELIKKLAEIQKNLKAPKDKRNNFAASKYLYRSCESILEALSPLLDGCVLTLNDELVMIGDRFYIKATAEIRDGESVISTNGYAREALAKKGMDDAQLTGACSSYARKYALCGLFAIDDSRDDPDAKDNTAAQEPAAYQLTKIDKEWIDLAKKDKGILCQLDDNPTYKAFIEGKL